MHACMHALDVCMYVCHLCNCLNVGVAHLFNRETAIAVCIVMYAPLLYIYALFIIILCFFVELTIFKAKTE